jgi:serine/threonine-protein kinase
MIPIYDFDSRGDVTWYTMELAEAGSVANLVERSGPRPFDEIAPKVDAVLDALAAAHASGIVHRDLKPENILIDRYRRWRITDFGIAKAEDEAAGATGTPAFAAPEQLLGEPQDPSVDCFAIGGIVVFVLTGEPPFSGADANVILAQQLAGEYGAARFETPVRRFLDHALNADSKKRYPDATVMRAAWRELREQMSDAERTRPSWLKRILGSESS